jgi:hypothetical protein
MLRGTLSVSVKKPRSFFYFPIENSALAVLCSMPPLVKSITVPYETNIAE